MHNFKNKIITFVRTFACTSCIQAIVVYLYIFFFTHYGNTSEYAEYIKSTYIVDFSVGVCLFGFNLLILREPIEYLKSNSLNIIIIAISLYSIVLSIYFSLYQVSQQFVVFTIILGVFNILYQFIFVLLIKFKKNKLASNCIILNFLVALIGLYICYSNRIIKFENVMMVRVIQTLTFVALSGISVYKTIQPLSRIEFDSIPKLFLSACPIGISSLFATLSLYVDKFILSSLSAADIAKYSVARIEIPFLSIFITNLSLVYMPKIKEYLNENNIDDIQNVFRHLFQYGLTLNLICFAILFFNARFIIDTLYSSSYSSSTIIFQIILISYLIRFIPYTNLIIALKLEHIIIKRIIIELVLQIILSFGLLHLFGLNGLACSLTLIVIVWSIPYNYYFFSKRLKCRIADLITLNFIPYQLCRVTIPCLIVLWIRYLTPISGVYECLLSIMLILLFNIKPIKFILLSTK